MSSEIRLRFTGLISFSALFISLFTGLIFSTIIYRYLSLGDVGAWVSLGYVTQTCGIAAGMFPFWSARYTARGFEGAAKLGLLANLALAIPFAGAAVFVGPTLASAANTLFFYYVYAAILVVQAYILAALTPVVSVLKPHFIAYGFVTYEVAKIIVLLPLVAVLGLGVSGALTSLFLANLVQIILYGLFLRHRLIERVSYQHLKQWAHASPFNLFSLGPTFLAGLEGYIILFQAGPLALAFWGAALTLATPVAYASSLSTALYPKLLAGGTFKDVEVSWKMTLLFAIPFSAALIVLGPSLLSILHSTSAYVPAYVVLAVLTVRSFFSTFNAVTDPVITGTEKLDEKGSIRLRELARSRITRAVIINYVAYGAYIPLLWFMLQNSRNGPLAATLLTAELSLPIFAGIAIAKYMLARTAMRFSFPFKSAVKFCLIPVALSLLSPFVLQPLRSWMTLSILAAGGALYFITLYFIEDEVHLLIDAILKRARFTLR